MLVAPSNHSKKNTPELFQDPGEKKTKTLKVTNHQELVVSSGTTTSK